MRPTGEGNEIVKTEFNLSHSSDVLVYSSRKGREPEQASKKVSSFQPSQQERGARGSVRGRFRSHRPTRRGGYSERRIE